MKKEELLSQSITFSGYKCVSISRINEFFESNVCIPKGANRHPYADVLHAYAEGTEIEYKSGHNWYSVTDFPHQQNLKYRIKPSEPVYEWQWIDITDNHKAYMISAGEFKTDAEVAALVTYKNERKIEETKRERK